MSPPCRLVKDFGSKRFLRFRRNSTAPGRVPIPTRPAFPKNPAAISPIGGLARRLPMTVRSVPAACEHDELRRDVLALSKKATEG